MEKFLLMEKTNAEERPWYKKRKKKTGPKTKDFEQSRVKPKFVIHRAKMRFLLFIQVPALTHEL